jgi:hypothetical protein
VKAAAYASADGGLPSKELALYEHLTNYGGAMNVLGRPLGIGEIRRMNVARNIVHWYEDRNRSTNIVEWTNSNMAAAELLNDAHRLAVEAGLVKE